MSTSGVLDRLSGVKYPDGTATLYRLDPVGNRTGERKTLAAKVAALTVAAFFDGWRRECGRPSNQRIWSRLDEHPSPATAEANPRGDGRALAIVVTGPPPKSLGARAIGLLVAPDATRSEWILSLSAALLGSALAATHAARSHAVGSWRGPTAGLEWFVPVFFFKLLVAHLLPEGAGAPHGDVPETGDPGSGEPRRNRALA